MPSFTLVDHCLSGLGGHPIRMAETFLEADANNEAWGRKFCELKHPRLFCHFSLATWLPGYHFPAIPQCGATKWRKAVHGLECLRVLTRTNLLYFKELLAIKRDPASIWFVPNTGLYNLLGMVIYATCFRRQRIVCYFQSAPSRHLKKCGLLARLFRLRNLKFVSENERMSRQTSDVLGQPVHSLLFPLLPPRWLNVDLRPAARSQRPLRIIVLGLPRREKGFHWLPRIAEQLRPELVEQNVSFLIQTDDDSVRREQLDQELALLVQEPGIRFINSALGPEQYLRALHDSDAVFTPYTRAGYAERLSWIAIEALALGKPVLVTDATLAADVLKKFRCGLFFDEGDIEAMAAAVRTLIRQRSRLDQQAVEAAKAFREENNPARFFAQLQTLFGIASSRSEAASESV